ncbi:hypothetical protein HY485_02845, partial [Candidatus Woesearchaeota archaeon]|nr:hypothetical protein [Candidatus Woesearchaeota archaeon]
MAEETVPSEKIVPRVIEDEMKTSYLDYSMSVIVGRALPDIRDGLKPVHRRVLFSMYEMGNTHSKPFKKSARVVGECFVKGTLVLSEKGLVPIENIQIGDVVFAQNGKNRVKKLYVMPARPLLKVRLANGTSVTATSSQKFKVLNNDLEFVWKEGKDIRQGDCVVIKADYPAVKEYCALGKLNDKEIHLNENLAYLLGQLISDGWVEKGCRRGFGFRCGFCSSSSSVIGKISNVLEQEFNYEARIEERHYEVESGSQMLLKKLYVVRINSSQINEFIVSSFALQNAFAVTKQIPAQILVSPKSVIFSFISGLIDGDGSVHNERNVIRYCSVSEILIDKLQILLQHLGIFAKRYVDEDLRSHEILGCVTQSNYPYFSLEISSRFAVLLANNLSLADEHKAECAGRVVESSDSLLCSGFDVIPYSGRMIFEELSRKHIGSGWYNGVDGKKFRSGIKYKSGTKIRYSKDLCEKNLGLTQIIEWGVVNKLKKIGSPLSKFVEEVIENNLVFLKVDSVEQKPAEITYDIEVEEDHNFIANGVVSHNCM